jgi:PAS domain-containing protein
MLARMGDGVVELDPKGSVLAWDEGVEELLEILHEIAA